MSGWLPKCSQVSWLSLIPAMLSCCVTLGKSLAFSDSYPKPKSTLQWSKRKCWSPKRKCWSEFLLLPVPAEWPWVSLFLLFGILSFLLRERGLGIFVLSAWQAYHKDETAQEVSEPILRCEMLEICEVYFIPFMEAWLPHFPKFSIILHWTRQFKTSLQERGA